MAYHEFFCLPLPEDSLDTYLPAAQTYAAVMKEHGMLQYMEAIAENVPRGTHTDFYRAVAAQEDETIVIGHAIWPDIETRDAAWEAAMKDPRMKAMSNLPFDGKRMFWGGFRPILEA